MVFFTIKIIRLLFRLVFKLFLLPFKLAKLAMGLKSDDDEYELEEPDGTLDGSTSAGGLVGSSSATDSDLLNVDASTAARNIVLFRWGLLGVGAFQFVVSLLFMVEISNMLGGADSTITVAVAGAGVAASLPVLAAVLLTRKPTAGWYLGMGISVLQVVGSVLTLPLGLLWIAVYGPLAYLGYTGRPAVSVIFGDDSSAEVSSDQSAEPTANADNAETSDGTDTEAAIASTAPLGDSESAGNAPDSDEDDGFEDEPTGEIEPTAASSDRAAAASSPEDSDSKPVDAETDQPVDESAAEPTEPSADALERHREALTDPDPAVRADAVRELAEAVESTTPDQTVVDAITERLDDEDAGVRSAACEVLGSIGAPQAEPHLRDCRIDPDPEVSRAASRALRNIH